MRIKAMNCIVLGNGIIGAATANMLKHFGHDVVVYDKDAELTECGEQFMKDELLPKADYVFSVVPTDYHESKVGLDMKIMSGTVSLFKNHASPTAVFVQRSSSLPGDARKLASDLVDRYVVFPSFAYRKTAPEDEINPPKIVLGAQRIGLAQKMFGDLFPMGLKDKLFVGTLEEAEFSKIASNLWQCLILSGWHSIADAVSGVPGMDMEFIRNTVIAEHSLASIDRAFGKAWGPDGRMEHDSKAFVSKFGSPMLYGAILVNDELRATKGSEMRSGAILNALKFKGKVSRSHG